MIEISKNQYSSNIIRIATVKNTKAHTKALDKALTKHSRKQVRSIVSIDIQETNKQYNNTISKDIVKNTHTFFEILKDFEEKKQSSPEQIQTIKEMT